MFKNKCNGAPEDFPQVLFLLAVDGDANPVDCFLLALLKRLAVHTVV